MELLCKKSLGKPGTGQLFEQNQIYKIIQIKPHVIIMQSIHRATIRFRRYKKIEHIYAPEFIGDYFVYTPEHTRYVIIEKQNYLEKTLK